MSRTLILYSTTDGQTLRICRRLEEVMTALGQQVAMLPVAGADAQLGSEGIEPFERVVIGASIRYGKHQPAVFDFVRRHAAILNKKPSAFFTVNVVARKPAKNSPDTNPYMKKFLRQVPWTPAALGVFAGKIDYPKYSWRDRQVIRFIMWMTHGPTAPGSVVEFTDWERVEAFAREVAALGG